MSIYKACDIRGRFGSELKIEHASRLGGAIALLKGPTAVLVGGDGRVSTPDLKLALINGLMAHGCAVTDLGTVPTPLFYFARARLGIETAVMVTASHNPAPDNGFKVTLGALPITESEMQRLAEIMESDRLPSANAVLALAGAVATTCHSVDLLPAYLDFLQAYTPALPGMKVIVDCASGMSGLLARQVWSRSGANCQFLLEEVDGRFPVHAPNPAEEKNLTLLQESVRREGADLGVAYDGDADRVVFVDELGQALTNDRAIVLFARDALRGGPEAIVYDQKCSRVVSEAVMALNGRPVMELSGHTYIKRTFLEQRAAYAGEMSGHHFFRSIGGDDGIAASLIFARILQASGLPLSRLAATVPAYPITPDIRIPMAAAEVEQVIADLKSALAGEAELTHTDGLRIEFADGWGLVRRSVTEAVITMRFEGVDQPALQRVIGRVGEFVPALRDFIMGDIGSQGLHF